MDESEREEQLKRWADNRPDLCQSSKMFNLGAHGTALVSCGLVKDHDVDDDEDDERLFSPGHVSRKQMDDGSSVTFRWTS